MKNKKRGQAGIVPAFIIILNSLLVASAVVTNSTNESLNITLVNIVNETPITNTTLPTNETSNLTTQNQALENITLTNQTIIINLSVPIENLTIINQSLPKKLKNLSEIIEKHKNKFNNETEKYLKNIKDKKEVKDYIIKFRNSIDESKLVNVTLDKKIERFKVTKIKGEVEDIEDLIEDNEVEFFELEQNVEVLGEITPFNIKKIKADSVWNLSNGSGVKVAVLDTGIGMHDDLAIAGGISFVDNNYFDSNGHGTSIAGVIAALLNYEGLAGVAPEVSLYSVKIMQGSTGDLSNAIAGIEWAIDNNISIVSMSFGFDSYSQIFKEVLQEAYNNNILLIAASGNNGQDNILYPAKYDTVIAVGATAENDNLASFSSYGFEQELVAPGIDINSTYLGNGYSVSSGTSMAAPHVAGVAALIKAFNNSLTNEQIRAKLRNDALDLGQAEKDDLYGYGLVQVNLQTTNFTITNLTYFYEVFNISNFGLPNITYNFWLNGTGTIDDVSFMPGYYLVNLTFDDGSKKSNIYNVDEFGTLILLSHIINLSDDYILACPTGIDCKHDSVVFKNWALNAKNIPQPAETILAECFDWTNDNVYDKCFGTQTDIDNCRTNTTFDTACQEASPSCTSDGSLGEHSAPTSTSQSKEIDSLYCYNSAGYKTRGMPQRFYYICSSRQYVCTSTTQYADRCFYTGGTIDIGTITCPADTSCDSNADEANADFGTNGNSTPASPCTSGTTTNLCNGTISVIVTDSKSNPINGTKVYNNGILNGTTDSDGFKEINYRDAVCGNSQSIDIYCSDNSTFCGTKSSTIDNNNDYDSLMFDCSICINKTDLSIKTSDVTIKTQGGKSNITALITVEKVNQNNVVIDFRGLNSQTGKPTQNESKIISVSQYVNQNVSVLWDTNSTDFVSITVDFTNVVAETDDKNNYIKKSTSKPINAYIDVTTDYPVLVNTIKNFLGQYVNVVSSGQDVNIYVGRKNSNIPKETLTKTSGQNWMLTGNLVQYNSKKEGLPYNGIVVRSGNNIYVFGNEIDGDIATLRKLVDNQEFYFSKSVASRVDYISEEDLDGLFVFDYLHTDENQAKYRKNNANFVKVVENVLNANVYSLAIKRVLTANDNTSLRLKNINAELSPKFKNFSNPRPVVLGHGLFGDLFGMEKLGLKIATDQKFQGKYVRDTWLIEYSGGPNTECANCPNYTYGTLVDYYWPALIGGVLKYANTNKVDYVGYSAGGGLGLRSYEKYYQGTTNPMGYFLNNSGQWVNFSLPANFVEQMALIAPMAAFDGTTRFTSLVDSCGIKINNQLSTKSHINRKDIIDASLKVCNLNTLQEFVFRQLPSTNNISYNFWVDIVTEVQNKSNTNPKLSSINKLLVIYNAIGGFSDDFVIPDADISYIYTNSNASKKYKGRTFQITGHSNLPDEPETYDPLLSKFLNNITYSFFDNLRYIVEED
ncbi:S8 family serine peptidase [Candidatus Woesearchaeota archaeon]|nr:S8 family serine peptidase [Candidatus Woesearchaeota archaeon]